jgi:hypothetical protein
MVSMLRTSLLQEQTEDVEAEDTKEQYSEDYQESA